MRQEFAQANGAVYLPYLAMSLKSIGTLLGELGQREGLSLSIDAMGGRSTGRGPSRHPGSRHDSVGTWRSQPAVHLPDLAASLFNLGAIL